MIKKIQLEDFMAHRATSIELSPGVTVITGPNNVGKSAIVEAIRYLVYNPAPKNVIRHGAKKAVVRLELDSGEIITWQRQDKNASYAIQRSSQEDATAEFPQEEYHKFGRTVPDDVRALLRLEQVETDTDSLDIHIGNQRQPIFLLDRPGSHAAGFFAASTEADYLVKMQQALKRRIDQSKASRKIIETELAAMAWQLSQYEPLNVLETGIKQVESLYATIIETSQQLPLLADLISQMREARAQLAVSKHAGAVLGFLEGPPALKDITGLDLVLSELEDKTRLQRQEAARTAVFACLSPPPAIAATAGLEALLASCRANLARHDRALSQDRVLSGLTAPRDLHANSDLTDLIPALQVNHARQRAASQITAVLAHTQEPPTLELVGELPGLIQSLVEQSSRTKALQHRHSTLRQLPPPPEVSDISLLDELVAALDRENRRQARLELLTSFTAELLPPPATAAILDLENSLSSLIQATADFSRQQSQLSHLSGQLDRKEAEIQEYLLVTGLCPLCGSPLDLGHFLEKQHD